MAYQCYPWHVQPPQQDTMFLVSGELDLNKLQKQTEYKLGPADFTLEKIQNASLLKQPSIAHEKF